MTEDNKQALTGAVIALAVIVAFEAIPGCRPIVAADPPVRRFMELHYTYDPRTDLCFVLVDSLVETDHFRNTIAVPVNIPCTGKVLEQAALQEPTVQR